jgi:hypothetical protein
MSHPLIVRLNDATIARPDKHAKRLHLPPRTLARRYIQEGLRMDEHPLIQFVEGPAGRRARLACQSTRDSSDPGPQAIL